MSKSNAQEIDYLDWYFQAVTMPISGATQLQIHLHTADPTESGITTASIPTYTGYSALTVDRDPSDWDRTGSVTSNAVQFQFDPCTAGSSTITHFSVSEQGSTQIDHIGTLTSPLSVAAGITPLFVAGAMTFTED